MNGPGGEEANVRMIDTQPLAKEIQRIVSEFFDLVDKPGMAVAFTLPPDYQDVHWITNVSREDGIKLFEETAAKMRANTQG